MKRNFGRGNAALVALLVAGVAGTAVAGQGLKLKARPGVFDPDNTGAVSAQWVAKEGLPDAGKSDHALILEKNDLTSAFSAAGAVIDGAEGHTVDYLGFDIRADSHIGAGSPRFNLLATDGFHFIGGAANGTITGVAPDRQGRPWARVRFDAQSPAQAFPPVAPGATVISLTLIVDEGTDAGPNGGNYVLDNIAFKGFETPEVLIGKPGNND